MTTRTCKTCRTEKPLSDFEKTRNHHRRACKVCRSQGRLNAPGGREYMAIKARESYMRHQERQNQRDRLRRERGLRRPPIDPIKLRAQQAVRYAVKKGRMDKPETCSECGKSALLSGHHHDYSKPLDVAWLCHQCHMKAHRKYPQPAH